MTKIFDSKFSIHIISEILVMSAMTVYFSSKNKQLNEYIKDLTQQITKQETLLQKHEQIIRQLIETIKSVQENNFERLDNRNMNHQVNPLPLKHVKHSSAPLVPPTQQNKNRRIIFNETFDETFDESDGSDENLSLIHI